jgi:two-component system, OmpR family, sensor histidine kinase BaeS
VWVRVSDSGPGIAEDALKHIFDTFWREDDARTTPGLGLGLSIAYKIIEAHGGTIQVESALGQGSTFTVSLPGNKL